MEDVVAGLIGVLFNQNLDVWDREEAGMDLRIYFEDDRALEALVKMGSDADIDRDLAEACGDSIGEIFVQRQNLDQDLLMKLAPPTRSYVMGYIRSCKPEWIEEYNLEEFLD